MRCVKEVRRQEWVLKKSHTAAPEAANQTKYFLQTLGPPVTPLYTQPTVMLIDDQAQSHSEHSTVG